MLEIDIQIKWRKMMTMTMVIRNLNSSLREMFTMI